MCYHYTYMYIIYMYMDLTWTYMVMWSCMPTQSYWMIIIMQILNVQVFSVSTRRWYLLSQ